MSVTKRSLGRDLVPVVGQQGPRHQIEAEADASQDGEQHECGADDDRVNPEPVGEPRGHAADPLVIGAASDADAAKGSEDLVQTRLRVGSALYVHVLDLGVRTGRSP